MCYTTSWTEIEDVRVQNYCNTAVDKDEFVEYDLGIFPLSGWVLSNVLFVLKLTQLAHIWIQTMSCMVRTLQLVIIWGTGGTDYTRLSGPPGRASDL